MRVSQELLLHFRQSGSWTVLEGLAQQLIAHAKTQGGEFFSPRLGGGTRLMLALEHRISHDIDLFVESPGWLPHLSPRLNDTLDDVLDTYTESSSSLKLVLDAGEIDFIVATNLLADHDQLWNPQAPETSLVLEPPAEVLAKKLFFRGWALTARDLFDWWALEEFAPSGASLPHEALANLLAGKKIDALNEALIRLTKSSLAQTAWEKIQCVEQPEIQEAAQWALNRVQIYKQLASSLNGRA